MSSRDLAQKSEQESSIWDETYRHRTRKTKKEAGRDCYPCSLLSGGVRRCKKTIKTRHCCSAFRFSQREKVQPPCESARVMTKNGTPGTLAAKNWRSVLTKSTHAISLANVHPDLPLAAFHTGPPVFGFSTPRSHPICSPPPENGRATQPQTDEQPTRNECTKPRLMPRTADEAGP